MKLFHRGRVAYPQLIRGLRVRHSFLFAHNLFDNYTRVITSPLSANYTGVIRKGRDNAETWRVGSREVATGREA